MEPGRANAPSIRTAIRSLETIAGRDPNGRGLSRNAPTGVLGPAAFDLLSGRRVVILTGFCVRSESIGETDGPPGALAVARALRVLGKKVLLVSDGFSLPLLRAGCRALSSEFRMLELTGRPADDAMLDRLVSSFKPTHVLAIERPGSAPDGHRYSMRGEILDDIAPAADRLFTENPGRGYATIAVGDGGNELGMGSLRSALKDSVDLGDTIFCGSPSDYPITAGISNWGGYALAAALSLLSGALLLSTAEAEGRVMEALLGAGAVDGCTKARELSVDGILWDAYVQNIQAMYALTVQTLEERRAKPEL